MDQDRQQYKRLPGTGKNFFMGINTLWLGKDHVLAIDSRRLAEDYKRFYFEDIQALITRKTAVGKVENLILGVFCAACALVSAALFGGGVIFFGACAGFFFLLLTINWLRGPTCACHIRTGVQIERLPSLNRIKTARKAIDLLRPRIEAVQGKLTSRHLQAFAQARAGAGPVPPESRGTDGASPEKGHVHKILFLVLILNGLLVPVDIFLQSVWITLMSTAMSLALGTLVVIALVRQHGSNLKTAVKTTTWMSLVYVCADFLVGYIIFFYIAFKNPQSMHNQWEMVQFVSTLSHLDSPWLMGFDFFAIAACFAFGISGLVLMRDPHRRRPTSRAVNTDLSGAQPTVVIQE